MPSVPQKKTTSTTTKTPEERKRLALRATIARAVAEYDEGVSPQAIDDPNGNGHSLHTAEAHLERAMGMIAGAHHDGSGFGRGEVEKVLGLLAQARQEVQCFRRALERAGVLRSWSLREAYEHLEREDDEAEVSDDPTGEATAEEAN